MKRLFLLLSLLIVLALSKSGALAVDDTRVQYVIFTLFELADIPQNEEVYTSAEAGFYRLGEFLYPEYDASLLAWRELYILDALLDLFELTGDQGLLKLFRARAEKNSLPYRGRRPKAPVFNPLF